MRWLSGNNEGCPSPWPFSAACGLGRQIDRRRKLPHRVVDRPRPERLRRVDGYRPRHWSGCTRRGTCRT